MLRTALFLIALAACTQSTQARIEGPRPVQPTPAQSVSDSVVAAVLFEIATRGLPDFKPRQTVFVQRNADIVSSASLPVLDSVEFVLLDSAGVQHLANQIGSVNVVRVERPIVYDDTAHAGASNRVVWRQERIGRMISTSGCSFRARRTNAHWQVDSTLGCLIS